MLTTSFSDARKNLTEIADRVSQEGVEFTVFKRSKPLFKIVPVGDDVAHQPRASAEWSRSSLSSRFETDTPQGMLGELPDGGDELFDYMMRLRDLTPRGTSLANLTPDDLKRELAARDV